MSSDEPTVPGSINPAEGGSQDPIADELADVTDRLEHAPWEEYERRPWGEPEEPAQEEGPGMMHAFLDQQLRERPLPTLLAAVAAGWLVGKLLR